jgi:hypothetical protein
MKKRLHELTSQTSIPNIDKSYILKVELMNVTPMIWRRVRVPANITLNLLHDKVLAPAMGWVRDYHGMLIDQKYNVLLLLTTNNH